MASDLTPTAWLISGDPVLVQIAYRWVSFPFPEMIRGIERISLLEMIRNTENLGARDAIGSIS